jgi:hypothetical protein
MTSHFHGRRMVSVTPYYSRIRFTSTRTGAGPFTYTIAQGAQAVAFAYGKGNDMSAAGFTSTTATLADTNLITAGQTIANETVLVKGISIQVLSTTNSAGLVAAAWPEMSVVASFNGLSTGLLLGTPGMMPGASGLYGQGRDDLAAQPIPGGRPLFGFFTNGLPGCDNKARIPEGIKWKPAGRADSTFNLIVRFERSVAFTTQLADEAAAAGIRGYANPAGASTFIDLMVQLHGQVYSARSGIQ